MDLQLVLVLFIIIHYSHSFPWPSVVVGHQTLPEDPIVPNRRPASDLQINKPILEYRRPLFTQDFVQVRPTNDWEAIYRHYRTTKTSTEATTVVWPTTEAASINRNDIGQISQQDYVSKTPDFDWEGGYKFQKSQPIDTTTSGTVNVPKTPVYDWEGDYKFQKSLPTATTTSGTVKVPKTAIYDWEGDYKFQKPQSIGTTTSDTVKVPKTPIYDWEGDYKFQNPQSIDTTTFNTVNVPKTPVYDWEGSYKFQKTQPTATTTSGTANVLKTPVYDWEGVYKFQKSQSSTTTTSNTVDQTGTSGTTYSTTNASGQSTTRPYNDWEIIYRYLKPELSAINQTMTKSTAQKLEQSNKNLAEKVKISDWEVVYKYIKPDNTVLLNETTISTIETGTIGTTTVPTRPYHDWEIIYKYYRPEFNHSYALNVPMGNDQQVVYKYERLPITTTTADDDNTTATSTESTTTDIESSTMEDTSTMDYTSTTEDYTSTTEDYETSTTEDYTTTVAMASDADDDAKQVQRTAVVIGDILSIQWANAICMLMINLVAAATMWIGGEVTWVGRSTDDFFRPIDKWLSDSGVGKVTMQCVARAACEYPNIARPVTALLTAVTAPEDEFVNVIQTAATSFNETNGRNCRQLYPCVQPTKFIANRLN